MPNTLGAAIFDVDGTMAESERHGHRVAFNRALADEGLPDVWDEDLYGDLLRITGGEARLRHYFTRHAGRTEDEAAVLAARVHATKTRIFREVAASGAIPPRPGLRRTLADLTAHGVRLAVATTGSRAWVVPLLARLAPETDFEVVITGDDVARRKPDPEAFTLAAERLGVAPDEALAVEDSANGVRAALDAGLCCVAVPGDYNTAEDCTGAALVVDGYGEPEAPARVLGDPYGVPFRGVLDATVFREAHELAQRARAM